MTLARTLGFYLLSMAWLAPAANGVPAQQNADQPASSANSPAQAQSAEPTNPAPAAKAGTPSPTSPARKRRRRKISSNCLTSPASHPSKSPAAQSNSGQPVPASLPPCAPSKKVVRNGGSSEPSIQLIGGNPAQQASQHSTEQLVAATHENLKKIADRPLAPNNQEMVNQIKQFMDQSKTAVAAGDIERGHSLAQKAHLLSEELLKP
jgi:hypothetical protein